MISQQPIVIDQILKIY